MEGERIPDYAPLPARRWPVYGKRIAIVAMILCAIAFGLWVSGLFTPWSEVNCRHQDIDIATGRIRHQRYFLYVNVHERIEDSELTRALDPAEVAAATPEWHRVNTFSPGLRHSPHYVFHGAIAMKNQLVMAWDMGQITPAARRETSRRLLQDWQKGGHDSAAYPYLREVLDRAFKAEEKPIDIGDLPK